MEGEVAIPPENPRWHAVAKRFYATLRDSGESKFYEPSDWALAYLIAESLSRDLKPQAVGIHPETGKVIRASIPLKGASLAAYLKACGVLGVSEGDRRRIGIEIERRPKKSGLAPVSAMDDYRNALGG